MSKNRKVRTLDAAYIAIGAALIAVCSWISIPWTVPFTMQTFGVFFVLLLLGGIRGTISIVVYILMGLVGVPVFSGFSGGFQKLAGVTGGYLIGYLPCAFLAGLGAERAEQEGRKWLLPVMMVIGTAVLYAIGTAWFMIQTGTALGAALSMCVLPFLPGDAAKIAAAALLTVPVRKATNQFRIQDS